MNVSIGKRCWVDCCLLRIIRREKEREKKRERERGGKKEWCNERKKVGKYERGTRSIEKIERENNQRI
jgi:hypothetical protein